MVKWLLEKDVFRENLQRLQNSIIQHGHEFKVVEYVPFSAGKYDQFNDNDCVIFYGSLNFARQLKKDKPWVPGVWCSLENFLCQKYFVHFGKWLLNQHYTILPLVELIRKKYEIVRDFGFDDQVFVRPCSGFKEFAGQTLDKDNLTLDNLGFGYYHEDPSLLVVVSEPKRIDLEYRVVICEKQAITGSQYKINRELEVDKSCPQPVLDFAEKIAQEAKWEPDPIYVMDIAQIGDMLYLLELNAFSTSGLYDCDIDIIVDKASKLAQKEWQEVQ